MACTPCRSLELDACMNHTGWDGPWGLALCCYLPGGFWPVLGMSDGGGNIAPSRQWIDIVALFSGEQSYH